MHCLTVSIAIMNPDMEMFKKMLLSLKENTPELTELIINDNGNSPDAFALVKEIFPFASGILNPTNIGFGKAHNQALLASGGVYFAVLNDDIEFFENWSTPMIEALQDKTVGQVSMRKGQYNGWHPNGNAGFLEDPETPEYCEGSCFMMRAEVAKEFGLFDEVYELAYCEDADLSLRLRRAGYILKTVDVNWIHHRATTATAVDFDIEGYRTKNFRTFRNRWSGYLKTKSLKPLMVVKRGGAYGDVFLMGPILQALKEKHNVNIALMSQVPEVLIHHPAVDGYATYNEPMGGDFFCDLDFSYEKDFRRHIMVAYAQIAGVELKQMHGDVYTGKENEEKITKLIGDEKGFVTLDLSNSWAAKQWGADGYRVIAKYLRDKGLKVYGLGVTNRLLNIPLDKNFLNTLSILDTAELMKRSALHITHEGLTGHFAQALNIPHVILYGCTSPEYVSDTSLETWRGVVTPVACKGCRHQFIAGCGITCHRNYVCMQMITPDMVIEQVASLMNTAEVSA